MGMNMTTQPTSATSLSDLISHRQDELGLSDADLCHAIGFDKLIAITLIKAGTMRMPLNKIPTVARALSLEPGPLLKLALEESSPGLLELIKDVLDPMALTECEVNLINHLRRLAGDTTTGPIVFEGRGVVALVAV
jgi:hypothetical protein